ncbi:hypothetical protein KIF24_09165 [Micromonospora sp. Llam7]|uniref:hypothetical protein n=1 Tax=Micromonospora tarapacensis TaxID=2835305 RepID=UPI001C838E30|nr:hypothetical protein [Micromonospora tarapacensis]MBX7266173.1 hypothetical protein [Micromonospora tarapacensis]
MRPWVDGTPVAGVPAAAGERFRPPAGWAWHADDAGFRVAVPTGWRYSRDNDVACFQDPATGRALSVAAGTDAAEPVTGLEAVRDRQLTAGTLPSYREFRLGRVGKATEWEFGWLTPHGERLRAVQIVSGGPARGRSWTLGWITHERDWPAAAAQLVTVRDSFRPAR